MSNTISVLENEIKKMLKIGKKVEQQSFSSYGLEDLVDNYFQKN